MKRSNLRKRLTAAAVMVSVFMTEQSIIYASGTGSVPEQTFTETEQESERTYLPDESSEDELLLEEPAADGLEEPSALPQEDEADGMTEPPALPQEEETGNSEEEPAETEQTEPKEISPKLQSEEWHPLWSEEAMDAEAFLYEQDTVGAVEEEYQYEDSYGKQLSGTLSGELYDGLKADWEESEESGDIVLGDILTSDIQLEGEEYESFRDMYSQAAQNAFDAFWYDEADVQELDKENSSLRISYEGRLQEDGTCQWNAKAEWKLVRSEEEASGLEEETQEEGTEQETSAEEDDRVRLEEIFQKTAELCA